jgi:endonuclease III
MADAAGGSEFTRINRLTVARLEELLAGPPALHRFPEIMAQLLRSAIERIAKQYNGNASRIWSDRPSSAALVYRFLEFDGIGPKIATMAANILAQQFGVPIADHYSIDISPDVHVRRVFTRLGLVPSGATVEQVVYRARGINPEFPGLLDRPALHIGREWCKPKSPLCGSCIMSKVCPKIGAKP